MNVAERAARCLMLAFFIAPPVFVLVELSPTAWAICLAVALLINNPRSAGDALISLISPFGISLIVLAVLAAVSALWSGDPARSLRAAGQLAAFIFIGAVVINDVALLSAEQRDRVWKALSLGAVLALCLLASIEITFKSSDATIAIRSFHKTTFYGLLFAAVLLFPDRGYQRLRLLVVLFVFAVPTLLFGKTSGVNLMILLTAPILLLAREGLRRALIGFCLLYCVVALAAPFIVEQVLRQTEQTRIMGHIPSYMARLELWHLLAREIVRAPWLGHGADITRIAPINLTGVKYYDLPDIPSAHNMVFDVWYELGLAGIGVLLWIIVAAANIIGHWSRGPLLVGTIMLLATVIEFSVDHRIWLSWVQGALVLSAAICMLKGGKSCANGPSKGLSSSTG